MSITKSSLGLLELLSMTPDRIKIVVTHVVVLLIMLSMTAMSVFLGAISGVYGGSGLFGVTPTQTVYLGILAGHTVVVLSFAWVILSWHKRKLLRIGGVLLGFILMQTIYILFVT